MSKKGEWLVHAMVQHSVAEQTFEVKSSLPKCSLSKKMLPQNNFFIYDKN